MSAEKLTCLQQLQQNLEKEAIRMSAKYKESDLAELDTDQQHRKPSPEKEVEKEVRLNIPEQVAPVAKANIFSQRPSSQPVIDIFGGSSKSVNLFSMSQQSNPQQSLNIFTTAMASTPAILIKDADELSENSQGSNLSHQELKEPTELIMKFDYEKTFEKLGEWRVIKFRAGVGAVKERLVASLEKKINSQEPFLYLVLRSEITKVVVYQAFLFPGVKVEHFMGKKENLKLSVFKLRIEKAKEEQAGEEKAEGDEAKKDNGQAKEKKTEEREQVKLQFEKEEDAQAFEEQLSKHSKTIQ